MTILGSFVLTTFILDTTISLTAGDRDTRLITKRPSLDNEFLTVERKDSSIKSAAGHVIPELHKKKKVGIYKITKSE